jgi:hypothetical protein
VYHCPVRGGHRVLDAHLWDLRAHAESKLRSLSRVQQLLAEHERAARPTERAVKRAKILEQLTAIIMMTETLHSVAQDALEAADRLPT